MNITMKRERMLFYMFSVPFINIYTIVLFVECFLIKIKKNCKENSQKHIYKKMSIKVHTYHCHIWEFFILSFLYSLFFSLTFCPIVYVVFLLLINLSMYICICLCSCCNVLVYPSYSQ